MNPLQIAFSREVEKLLKPQYRTKIIRRKDLEDESGIPYYQNIDEKVSEGLDLNEPATYDKLFKLALIYGQNPKMYHDIKKDILARQETKESTLDKIKLSPTYRSYEMLLRPLVEKYGGTWRDDATYWENFNRARDFMPPEKRRQLDEEVREMLKPRKQVQEKDKSFEMALSILSKNPQLTLQPEELVRQARALAELIRKGESPTEDKKPVVSKKPIKRYKDVLTGKYVIEYSDGTLEYEK